MSLDQPSRDLHLLYPRFAHKVGRAIIAANSAGFPVAVFEAWRSPQRQDYLYAQGRTREGKIVTKAQAWQSWHQYGVATDVALLVKGKWSWDFDPAKVAPFFTHEGLTSLAPFEQCHFQLTNGLRPDQALGLVQSSGLQRLWLEIG
jgi:D-alanyl-D-alanine carboxypeptidase